MDKRKIMGSLFMGFAFFSVAVNAQQPLYKNATLPVEERVNDLLGRMTLEEKILQLNQYTLGRNNNENNLGEAIKQIPAGIGSLIYFDETLWRKPALGIHRW